MLTRQINKYPASPCDCCLFAMILLTFGRLVVAVMPEFFTWWYHLNPRIYHWQLMWKHCSLWESSVSSVHVSQPYSSTGRMLVWYTDV